MTFRRTLVTVLGATLMVAAIAGAQGQKPTPQSGATVKAGDASAKLPPPILAAFRQAYPNAVVKNVAKETEKGKTVWEVESTDKGLNRNLIYHPDGTVAEMEEEVALASVPPAVLAAVKAKYPKATVTLAEQTTIGQTVTYELTLKGAAVKVIELTPEGKAVAAAKEAKEPRETKK